MAACRGQGPHRGVAHRWPGRLHDPGRPVAVRTAVPRRGECDGRGAAWGAGVQRGCRAAVRHPADPSWPTASTAASGRHEELAMTQNQVKILEGNTFVVSDERGDI